MKDRNHVSVERVLSSYFITSSYILGIWSSLLENEILAVTKS